MTSYFPVLSLFPRNYRENNLPPPLRRASFSSFRPSHHRFSRNLTNAIPRIRRQTNSLFSLTTKAPTRIQGKRTISPRPSAHLSQSLCRKKNPTEHRKASTEPAITFVYVQIPNCYETTDHVLSFIGPSKNPYVSLLQQEASTPEVRFSRIP